MIRKISKNKKAVSPMIGYILLISIAVVLSLIVYTWLKTYIPRDALECPDSTSLFVKTYVYDGNQLSITIKNNGNFNIAGYFIRAATNDPEQGVAETDLSSNLIGSEGEIFGLSILFDLQENKNSFSPSEEATHVFDTSEIVNIYFIEITPIRIQEQDSIQNTVTCGRAKIKEELN